jgi:replicative DNA helicase
MYGGAVSPGMRASELCNTHWAPDDAAPHHAERVLDLWRRRTAIAVLRKAAIDLQRGDCSVDVAPDRILREWPKDEGQGGAVTIADALRHRIEVLTSAQDEAPRKVPSSIPTINAWWGGYGLNWLVYVGGRPRMGKTSFVVGEAIHAASKGVPTYIASIEMSQQQIADRILSRIGGVNGESLLRGNLSAREWDDAFGAVASADRMPLWVDDRPATADELCARIRTMHERHGVELIVIDYVQRIGAPRALGRNAREYDKLAAISAMLMQTKKALPVTILCAAQCGRDSDTRPPTLADLKGAGNFEEDADCVIFPFRPGVVDENADPSSASIIVGKQRHGRDGVIPARWDGASQAYTESAPTYREHEARGW